MKRRKKSIAVIFFPVLVTAVLLLFLTGMSNLTRGHAEEDKRRLEDVLRQSAVACYSAEGMYPPDLAYLVEHYGVQINESRYTVRYVAVAENLMPDITVLDK